MEDSPESIARDIAAIERISAVPVLLRIVCQNTGMRFAAVARVTDGTWTACAVQDDIAFGLKAGGQLELHTTLCTESRAARKPIVIDQASQDPVYAQHRTPRLYGIESYISVPILRPDGAYFGNLCAIDPKPARVSEPKTIAMFESFAELIGRQLDVEERQLATETALLDARQAAELREQFIAVLGHDLRNPLASIGAIGELLARRPESGVAGLGQRVRGSVRRMSQLIDDVMDFARTRLGAGIGVQLRTVEDLEPALRNVVSELRDAHPQATIAEHYGLRGPVVCDLGRVQQLLSNLLANALNYGAADQPVQVDAALEEGWLVLSVKNQGAPIAPAHLDKIFEPYWRPADSPAVGGLGLGLHICAQIARGHGGTVQVTSSAEAGTCFTARLAVPQEPPAPA